MGNDVEKKGNKGWRGRWRGRRGGGLLAAARPVSSSDAVGATSPVEERRESRAEGGTPLEEGERELERAPEGKMRRRRPTRGGTPVSAGGGAPCRRWSGGVEGLLAPAQALEGRGVGDGERKNEPVLCNEWQKRVITFQLHIQVQNEKVWSCAEEVLQNSKPICTTAPEFGLLHGVLELGCLAAKLVGVGGVELWSHVKQVLDVHETSMKLVLGLA